ncbi:hypothetical protein [Rhizobium sp. L1K21]|uniref:hypothetical protein n=1 Tax=Rhizobium sp. L1K21 TaxID=2954933 RepID=UPI0020922FB1|nr:hypothetical protein [Rhizobium sp. L1K21]MCO6186571.1 hypothetical protein [Rhizobium sp. L1K21]
MSDSKKTANVKLEDKYQPLGLKAVKAATQISRERDEAAKQKSRKPQPMKEYQD